MLSLLLRAAPMAARPSLVRSSLSLSTLASEAAVSASPATAVASGLGASVAIDAAAPGTPRVPRLKFKNGFKRASSVMAEVGAVAQALSARRLVDTRPPLDDFNIGDAVAVTYALEHSEVAPSPVRGVVIGRRRKGLDSNFTILNAQDEEWYSATYTLASPLLRAVRVLRRNHHSDGGRRARRAKLNYLFGRDHKSYAVDGYTKETADVLREKRERKEAQRLGKVYVTPEQAARAAAAAAGGKAKSKGGAKGGAKPAAGGSKSAPKK